jgi:hypothetical protein
MSPLIATIGNILCQHNPEPLITIKLDYAIQLTQEEAESVNFEEVIKSELNFIATTAIQLSGVGYKFQLGLIKYSNTLGTFSVYLTFKKPTSLEDNNHANWTTLQ